jgi:hypothetical protein
LEPTRVQSKSPILLAPPALPTTRAASALPGRALPVPGAQPAGGGTARRGGSAVWARSGALQAGGQVRRCRHADTFTCAATVCVVSSEPTCRQSAACWAERTHKPALIHTACHTLHVTLHMSVLVPCSKYEDCSKPDLAAGEHLEALQAQAAAWGAAAAAEQRAGELREQRAAEQGLQGMSLEEAEAAGGAAALGGLGPPALQLQAVPLEGLRSRSVAGWRAHLLTEQGQTMATWLPSVSIAEADALAAPACPWALWQGGSVAARARRATLRSGWTTGRRSWGPPRGRPASAGTPPAPQLCWCLTTQPAACPITTVAALAPALV